jgi:acyl dehydratase
MPVHSTVARNFAEASENKIHSDDIARRFGFTSALVPGVTVFGHLAWPLTQRLGASWLQGSWVTTRFIKPAYHAETISLLDRETGEDSFAVDCKNLADVLLATLECTLEEPQPAADPHAQLGGAQGPADRVEISWDTVHVDEPFAMYLWKPDETLNREYAARVADDTELFRQGVLHPHAILSQANQVLVRRFVMPAWIHTGSEVRFRRLLRVGDAIEVRAVPLEKWERKGHQFIRLYVAYVVGGEVATEIWHTAIFRVAPR